MAAVNLIIRASEPPGPDRVKVKKRVACSEFHLKHRRFPFMAQLNP